jgi:hypothetical protein
MKFIPMYDLDRLSKEELQQYYLDACAFHGVPPELNVLAFTYMDSGDGARRRVLYAKKGATDIIRERLGISVADLRKEIFNGTLTYTCFGKNKDGRFEIAVGASYIDGLTGRALEVAIMVAQTRAIRRMTLQFAGAGLIDETELQADSKTTDVKEALTTPQPSVKPNSLPGKDITQEHFGSEGDLAATVNNERGVTLVDVINIMHPPTPAQLEAQQALSKVPEAVLAKESGEVAPEAPKRRQRVKPVELDTPFSFDNPVPAKSEPPLFKDPKAMEGMFHPEPPFAVPAPIIPEVKIPSVPAPVPLERLDAKPDSSNVGKLLSEQVSHSVVLELPNDQQMKTFRDRLFTYTNTILPQAGMVPTENIGGIGMKVRLFAQATYGQVLNQLTVTQWENMFKLFDSLTPVGLVKLIDETAVRVKK